MAAHARDHTRRAPERGSWQAEYDELSARDRRTPLAPSALERLGILAFLLGHEPVSVDVHTRAHNLALERGETRQAARSAFWVAFSLISAGSEPSRASGWAARGRRLLEGGRHDCVECGYLLLPQALEQAASGDISGAQATYVTAEGIGERFGDHDLTNLARQGRGRTLVGLGRVADGVALFDEVMVAVTAGELTPIIAGVVYCSVISACFDLLDIRRAQEWTQALNEWCQAQPGLVSYRGECLVHRAEILRLRGQWPEALDEARRACEVSAAARRAGRGVAVYGLAELHRLRGDMAAAEDAYRLASDEGRTPHPGLALLRLAQGQREVARAAIERMLAESSRGRQRADVLVAAVDILLASADVAGARRAAEELQTIAERINSAWLRATAASALGSVHLASGEARQALASLRVALTLWDDLDLSYESARVKALIGRACLALGDADGARLEWAAAAAAFRQTGAAPALAEVESLLLNSREGAPAAQATAGGLTSRELEVLRLVARGKTNRIVARELDISEKTVARHISNIFTKLDLSTRAAATAYAFTHGLMDQGRT